MHLYAGKKKIYKSFPWKYCSRIVLRKHLNFKLYCAILQFSSLIIFAMRHSNRIQNGLILIKSSVTSIASILFAIQKLTEPYKWEERQYKISLFCLKFRVCGNTWRKYVSFKSNRLSSLVSNYVLADDVCSEKKTKSIFLRKVFRSMQNGFPSPF